MSKKKQFRCKCDQKFPNKKSLIKHYRKEHADDPLGLYSSVGDIGDDFANDAIRALWLQLLDERNRIGVLTKRIDKAINETYR